MLASSSLSPLAPVQSNCVDQSDSDLVGYTRKLFDKMPQPIMTFPWSEAPSIFQSLLFGFVSTIAKYICLFLNTMSVSIVNKQKYLGFFGTGLKISEIQ